MLLVEQSLKHNAQDLKIKGYNDNYWTSWSPTSISRKIYCFQVKKKKEKPCAMSQPKMGWVVTEVKIAILRRFFGHFFICLRLQAKVTKV